MKTTEITELDDVIDSRDVIARIEDLTEDRASLNDEEWAEWDSDYGNELAMLESLDDDPPSSEWRDGVTLIRDSYFKDYARDLAEDVHGRTGAEWPFNCIDWDQAARELRMDYTSVEFGGETYWFR